METSLQSQEAFQLQSQEAFAYMQRRLSEENLAHTQRKLSEESLEFSYNVQRHTTNKFTKGIFGCLELKCASPITRRSFGFVYLNFERFEYDPNLPIFGITLRGYFPSIKRSRSKGIRTLARILEVTPKEIISSNRIQMIRDEQRYKKMESLKLLREKVEGNYESLSKEFRLKFKVKGKDFDDTYFAVKDLDLIVSLLASR